MKKNEEIGFDQTDPCPIGPKHIPVTLELWQDDPHMALASFEINLKKKAFTAYYNPQPIVFSPKKSCCVDYVRIITPWLKDGELIQKTDTPYFLNGSDFSSVYQDVRDALRKVAGKPPLPDRGDSFTFPVGAVTLELTTIAGEAEELERKIEKSKEVVAVKPKWSI